MDFCQIMNGLIFSHSYCSSSNILEMISLMTTKLIAKVNWTNHFYDEDYCWSFAWMYILVFDYSYLHPNCVNILTAFQQSHVTEEFFLLFPEYHRVLIKTFKTDSWLLSSVSRTVVTIGHNQKQTCVECHKLTTNDKKFPLASIIKCFITLAIIKILKMNNWV